MHARFHTNRSSTRRRENYLIVHVSIRADSTLWELSHGHLEALLNRFQYGLILRAAHERDTKTLGSKTTSTTDTMEIGISLVRHIVIDSNVDALNVNTTTKDISGNTNTSLELLELFITLDTVCKLVYWAQSEFCF